MELAKNQKGIKSLTINEDIWNRIIDPTKNIIVAYGSNGRGKSTIKDLFQRSNLEKNFELENEQQSNQINLEFGQSKFLIYDDNFVNKFVYSNDSINKNYLKLIMKTDEINEIISNKNAINAVIKNILSVSSKYISKIENIEKTLDIKVAENPTAAKRRFATTFIDGQLPLSYEEINIVNDPNHKNWWFEGLYIYKHNELGHCPWCKQPYELMEEELKNQINGVNNVVQVDPKLFSSKITKKADLESLIQDNNLNEEIVILINELMELIAHSIESNKETEIIDKMKLLRTKLEIDRLIFEEITSKVKYIDSVVDEAATDLTNRLTELSFFSNSEQDLEELSGELNYFISNNNELVTSIKNSNNQLVETIESSEKDINIMLENLGMNYKVGINKQNVIKSGLTETDDYVVLKSSNGKDVSDRISSILSYGERSTLAFVIFIQQVKNLSTRDTIIIFDDPISSYDIFRRFTTISIISSLREVLYKKILILTHESDFLISLIENLNINNYGKALLLNEVSSTEIELVEISSDYRSEVDLYRGMLIMDNNLKLSQRVVALRQLHDLYKKLTGRLENMAIYDYICKLIHYRKDEIEHWNDTFNQDIIKLFEYFGITYDEDIKQIGDENLVFNSIDELCAELLAKDIYEIGLEDLCCLRMVSEAITRNESSNPNKYKKSILNMWRLSDSTKVKKLKNYRTLLNSICHVDDEEIAWSNINIEDLKAVPRVIISQIISILN